MTKTERVKIKRKCMTEFMHYFRYNKLDYNNKKILENMEKCITKIFQLEIEEVEEAFNLNKNNNGNSVILEFIDDLFENAGQYISGMGLNKSKIIYNKACMYKGLKNKSKQIRLNTCKKLFRIVFHEIDHYVQDLMMLKSDVSSNEVLMYVRDAVLQMYLSDEFYSIGGKTGNYLEYALENSADANAAKKYLEIMKDIDDEILNLRNISIGHLYTSRYKADVYSEDGESYYKSDGLLERDDVVIPILDHLICERGYNEFLNIYPILQKEYHFNGVKKSAIELIENMKKEVNNISKKDKLLLREKRELIKDTQEMYYELIYRALDTNLPKQMICINTKVPWDKKIINNMMSKKNIFVKFINQIFFSEVEKKHDKNTQLTQQQISEINKIIKKVGKDESEAIFIKMSNYFQLKKQDIIKKSENMARAQEKNGTFIPPSNDGTIQIRKHGKNIAISAEKFIKTINPKLMSKKFKVTEDIEINAEEFIEKMCFKYLDKSGRMILKDGRNISAKQYVENYMLQMEDVYLQDYHPYYLVKNTIYSKNPWKIHRETKERLTKYYENKKQFITNISNQLSYIEKQNLREKSSNSQKKQYNKLSQEILRKYSAETEIVNLEKFNPSNYNNIDRNTEDEQSL